MAVGVFALLAIARLSADETDPGKSASQSKSARLEAEIQRLHEELASTRELLRQGASDGAELRLAQRADGPAPANDPTADAPSTRGAKSAGDKKADDKKLDTDAWQALDRELARKWRRGPGGPPGMHRGFHGGPPPWARHGFHGGPPWAHHHRHHGRGGPGCAHHHHHRHWGHHHRHGHRHGWSRGGPGRFGPGGRGGDPMLRITRRLDLLERRIDALLHEIRGDREGPERGGPMRDGPPHNGPPRDGPPRDGGPREAAPPRKPGT